MRRDNLFGLLKERIFDRYWVLPACVATGIVVLLPLIELLPGEAFSRGPLSFISFDASPVGARQLLSAVAGAVMTVVGVLFSITVLVLQQASAQYSPRVIENFVRSAQSQSVFGFYIGTFIYCMLLVRQIRDPAPGGAPSSPEPAILVAILLAIACLGLLIFYVHFIVHAIQSTQIIETIRRQTLGVLAVAGAERSGAEPFTTGETGGPAREYRIRPERTGYLQAVRSEKLKKRLSGRRWVLRARVMPGDFVDVEDSPVAVLTVSGEGPELELAPADIAAVSRIFEIGEKRTHAQDPRFGIRQLVDMALRALSPSVNDPTTAIECLNGLSSILIHFVKLTPQTSRLAEGNGVVILRELPFKAVLDLAFDQIFSFSSPHLPVILRIREILLACRTHCRDPLSLAEVEVWLRAVEAKIPSDTAGQKKFTAA